MWGVIHLKENVECTLILACSDPAIVDLMSVVSTTSDLPLELLVTDLYISQM